MPTSIRSIALLACAGAVLAGCGGGSSMSTTSSTSGGGTANSNASAGAQLTTPAMIADKTRRHRSAVTLELAASSFSVAPAAGSLTVSVSRAGSATGAVSAQFATANGTALSGADYSAVSGTLSWAAGDSGAKTFSVPIATNGTGGKTFAIALSNAVNATLAAPSSATVTITAAPVASGSSSGGATGSSGGSSSGGATGSSGGSSSGGATSSSSGASSGATGGLSIHVAGNRLVDGSGKTVQLRGVNVSGLEAVAILGWDPGNPWGGQTGDDTPNWSTIKTWGGAGPGVVNAVRLPLNEASWLGLSCVDEGGAGSVVTNGVQKDNQPGQTIKADPGGNYQATVAKSVADATAAGLYVILDLHLAAPGNACPTLQNAMADADHSVAFWTSLASAFKGNPAVIFELFNEPFLDQTSLVDDTPWADLLNGGGSLTQVLASGSPGVVNLAWKNAGMQQMLNAVRATGATNVVLAAPLAYASAMDGWLQYKPTDPAGQLGAVWHAYPADGYPTQVSCVDTGAANGAGYLPGCSAKIMADVQGVLAAGYPVVITEFGDAIGGSTAPWASKLLPFADANGISYLGWTWDTWSGFSADVLITDAAGTPTKGYGTYVKQHYVCVAAGATSCP